jgi:hypothetical protein
MKELFWLRAILYERSKHRVCNASQNACKRRPNFQMRKYIKTRVRIYTSASDAFKSALGVSNVAGGVANASVRNAVQSTLGVSFSVPSVAFQTWRFERSCSVHLQRYCVDYTKRAQNAAFQTRRFERSYRMALSQNSSFIFVPLFPPYRCLPWPPTT